MRWWVTFLEKYAQPTRLGKYQPGASENDKETLWSAMDAFGTNGKMMIPEGTMIELLEAARAGGADYQGMLDICNEAISKIVLSQTMTTDNGSSQSQANVHQDVKDDIVKADADLICSSFNEGPVKWLIDWNFPGVAYPRVWRQMDAATDLDKEADRDIKLQGLGISLKPEAIAAKYGDDYLIPDNKEQIPQLNGEQVNALVSIVSNAKQGGWSAELVAGMINGAFPNWPDEAVAAITKNLGSDAPTDQQAASNQPIDLDAAAAQFAAPKKKNCPKGLSCGNTCIARDKMCIRELSPDQQQILAQLRKAAGKGGAEDKAKLDKFKADVKAQQGREKTKPDEPVGEQSKIGGTLDELFVDAERIGNKYQTEAERAAFDKAFLDISNEMEDAIDRYSPDTKEEIIDYKGQPTATGQAGGKSKIKVPERYKNVLGSKESLDKLRAKEEAATAIIRAKQEAAKNQANLDLEPISPQLEKMHFSGTPDPYRGALANANEVSGKVSEVTPDLVKNVTEIGLMRPAIVVPTSIEEVRTVEAVPGNDRLLGVAKAVKKADITQGDFNVVMVKDPKHAIDQAKLLADLNRSQQIDDLPDTSNAPKATDHKKRQFNVDIKAVTSAADASKYDAKQLSDLADSIAAGGITQPPLVVQTEPGKFAVVGNHAAFAAAQLARKRDPKIETANMLIVQPHQITQARAQLQMLDEADNKPAKAQSEVNK